VAARIVVLGAPGTGKTTLCLELASCLRTRGHRVSVSSGRAPGQSAAPDADLVIDDSPEAPRPGDSDLTLLMGLDLPAHDAQVDDGAARAAMDAHLREVLTQAGASWRVIYGQGPERVQQALQAVAAVLPWAWTDTAREEDIGRWARLRASCEKCGDADCEHRLFKLGGSP
jgi:nicotinamide riboside kinase